MENRASPIVPTVGRIVLVRGYGVNPGPRANEELPAIITKVWGNENLSVHVFGEVGRPYLEGVKYDDDVKAQVSFAWRWMPYQVQAKPVPDPKADETFEDRLKAEYADLVDRMAKLSVFFGTETFTKLPIEHQELLDAQHEAMSLYGRILNQRIQLLARAG